MFFFCFLGGGAGLSFSFLPGGGGFRGHSPKGGGSLPESRLSLLVVALTLRGGQNQLSRFFRTFHVGCFTPCLGETFQVTQVVSF